jgi:uncharacterized delta-60 repeat protein
MVSLRSVWLVFAFLPPVLAQAQSGVLDRSFDPGTGVDQSVYSPAIQADGRVLIAGDFARSNGTARTNVARLSGTGSLDTHFDPGGAVGNSFSYLNAVAIQPGGKVLLGGSFNGPASTNLARLDTNGVLDTHFSFEADDTVNALAVQTNGSFVVGGFFTEINGTSCSAIARFSVDGVLDAGFKPALVGDALSSVFALALQSDGKIVLGGAFTNVSGASTTNIARLNPDGTPDPTFTSACFGGGQLSSAIYAVGVDGLGKVVAGGDFASVNGLTHSNLVRLNSNGTLDTTFNPAAGSDAAINSLVVQSDGKVLIGGFFTVVNGTPRNSIARLNADGSLDTTFDPESGADAVVYCLALQPDGKLLVGGAFSHFDGAPRAGVARVQNIIAVAAPPLVSPALSNGVFHVTMPTQSGTKYVLEYKNSIADSAWTALPAVAGDGAPITLIDSSATGPQRFYRVEVQ